MWALSGALNCRWAINPNPNANRNPNPNPNPNYLKSCYMNDTSTPDKERIEDTFFSVRAVAISDIHPSKDMETMMHGVAVRLTSRYGFAKIMA